MSNPESMQQLADRFVNDASFREEMCNDPEGAAERSGLPLDEEDKQALKSFDWSGSDEELKERVAARRAPSRSRTVGPYRVSGFRRCSRRITRMRVVYPTPALFARRLISARSSLGSRREI